MTKREAAIVTAYTGIFIGDFSTFHEYVEALLGRPILTHELASTDMSQEIKEASKADFIELCEQVTP